MPEIAPTPAPVPVKPFPLPTLGPSAPVPAARAAMTPESSALLNDKALGYQLGKGTLAGSLNSAVRFRVQTSDALQGARQIVPDSPTASVLAQTTQGAELIRQLHIAASSIDGLESKSDLKGFILPPNVDSVMANELLGGADTGDKESKSWLRAMGRSTAPTSKALRTNVQKERAALNDRYAQGVAAWNQDGWIIFRPDVARAMLTSVGAYTPTGPDAILRDPARYAQHVNHIPTHEVQHSATPVSEAFYKTPAKWMEEAVAEVMSDTPAILNRTTRKTGVTAAEFRGKLSGPSPITVGWKPWKAPTPNATQKAENEAAVSRNYQSSQDMLRGLLKMAGFTWSTNAGISQIRGYLQGQPVETLSARLAHTLGDRYGVPVSRRHDLAARISNIVDDPKGLVHLRNDFQLITPLNVPVS